MDSILPDNVSYPKTPSKKTSASVSSPPVPPNTSSPYGGFSTRAIHAGQEPEVSTGAIIPPIYMTSTYIQEAPAVHKGFDYTRADNPTFICLERQIASLEYGKYCAVFSAGLAAISASILSNIEVESGGDTRREVIAFKSSYGGTFRILTKILKPLGVAVRFIDVRDWEASLVRNGVPGIFIFECPTNPLLEIVDIQAVVRKCKDNNIISIMDNTFATPYHQQPLFLGIDLVVHSSTKYMGGHSDVIGGAVITNSEKMYKNLKFYRMSIGLNPSPFDCWLITRSLKTLGVRMERHSSNALAFASYLSGHSLVKRVIYPGLADKTSGKSGADDYTIATKQMKKGYGGMVTVFFHLTTEQTKKFVSGFEVFSLAESLGGIESLVEHPASMTHASIPKEDREVIGITDGLVRFSIGLEDVEDLISDVDRGLEKLNLETVTIPHSMPPTQKRVDETTEVASPIKLKAIN